MIISTRQFWILSIIVFLCCLLFALPQWWRVYKDMKPEPRRTAPVNVILPFGKNVSDWGDESLRIEWKLAVAKGKQTSSVALDEEIPVLYIAGALENKSDKPMTVESLTLSLESSGVEVLSVPFGVRGSTSFPLSIPPKQKVILQQDAVIPSSLVLGLLEGSLDLKARAGFVKGIPAS